MEKTQLSQLTVEKILSEGKYPAITVEETMGDLGSSSTTFRLDKVNTVTLSKSKKENQVIIGMDGSANLTFRFDTPQEADELFTYVMDRW